MRGIINVMANEISSSLPRIGITIGDPAGIGPEIVLRAVADLSISGLYDPYLIGDLKFIQKCSDQIGLGLEFIDAAVDLSSDYEKLKVFDLKNIPSDQEIGIETISGGKAAGMFIEKAVELWKAGKIDAISTAPINKLSLSMGGYDFPGHTEFLAHLTDTKEFAMSFFGGDLRVVLISTHVPLIKAVELVTTDRMIKLIKFASEQFGRLLGKKVKIAVAGINPHASENGLFGDEEAREIVPAIEHCLEQGIDVSGPFSPDTIFLRAFRGEFDAVVACYHDQATIAVKSLAFGSAVNVTLGLPLIRTSVDHGTAFDIAGKGIADPSSMKAAIKLAAELALTKNAVTVADA